MALSLYDVTVPPFIHQLKALRDYLKKGEAHFAGNEQKLLDSRLIADMQALPYQIQRVSDVAKGVAVRVAKVEPVVMEDNEKTFLELYDRIQKTIDVLEKVDPHSMDGMEDKEIVMNFGPAEKKFTGKQFVLGFAVPNFYFHATTAYALLRKEGVPLGKSDFMGMHLMEKKTA